MVVLRPNAFLLALLSALVLAAPCASAGVVGRARDHADGIARTSGLPPIPLLDRLPDVNDDVRWTLDDGGAEVEGGGMRMEASCTAGGASTGCSSRVCFMDPGNGALPVSLGDWGRGMYGVGFDLSSIRGGVGDVVGGGGLGPQPDGAEAPGPFGEGGNYGPYNGVFVNPTGHCA